MATYKKVNTLSPAESAYIAGLIDGEGTVTLSRKHRNENRQGLDLLKQISSYLKSYKYERTVMALEHYVRLTPRNGKYTDQQCEERKLFIDNFLKLRPSG